MKLLFWLFIFYSFLGFLLEIVFIRITKGDKLDRKCFLLSPLCPVYGFGALFILALPSTIRNNFVLLFLFATLLSTATEYSMGVFYSRVLKVRFWDYSTALLHLNGHVCLSFSLAWGLLGAVLIYFLHPLLLPLALAMPSEWVLPTFYFLLLDTWVSFYLLRRFQNTDVLRWYKYPIFSSLKRRFINKSPSKNSSSH